MQSGTSCTRAAHGFSAMRRRFRMHRKVFLVHRKVPAKNQNILHFNKQSNSIINCLKKIIMKTFDYIPANDL